MFSKDTALVLVVMILLELGIIFSLPVTASIKANTQIQDFNAATAALHQAPIYANLKAWQQAAKDAGLVPAELDDLGSLHYYSDHLLQLRASYPEVAALQISASTMHTTQIQPQLIVKTVDYLPLGHKMNLGKGENGIAVYHEVALNGAAGMLVMPTTVVKESQPEIIVEGTQTTAEAETIIAQLLHPEVPADTQVLGASADISNVTSKFFNLNKDEIITARSLHRIDNCSQNIDLIYNLTKNTYRNSSNVDLRALDCQTQSINFTNCSNCDLAPLGKTTRLSSAYTPELTLLTLPGGGRVTPETNAALQEMYDAGAAQNIFFRVRSAHRTFEQQQQLFANRKQTLISSGSSAAAAEIEANRTIAYPYYSEHHLGNTVDLNCHVCLGQQGSKGNAVLFKFLQTNASTYGFVISYPREYTALTGYNYEPWHLRYIGRDLSTEYAARKLTQDISLEQFLQEKSLYY